MGTRQDLPEGYRDLPGDQVELFWALHTHALDCTPSRGLPSRQRLMVLRSYGLGAREVAETASIAEHMAVPYQQQGSNGLFAGPRVTDTGWLWSRATGAIIDGPHAATWPLVRGWLWTQACDTDPARRLGTHYRPWMDDARQDAPWVANLPTGAWGYVAAWSAMTGLPIPAAPALADRALLAGHLEKFTAVAALRGYRVPATFAQALVDHAHPPGKPSNPPAAEHPTGPSASMSS